MEEVCHSHFLLPADLDVDFSASLAPCQPVHYHASDHYKNGLNPMALSAIPNEIFSFLRVFIAMVFFTAIASLTKRYWKAATQNVSTQYVQWLSHTCLCGAQLLYSLLPMYSSIALYFSVEIGRKPAGTQGKFPLLRWFSHRCKWRIQLLPSLFQAMYSSSSPNQKVNMSLGLNSIQLPGKEAVCSEGEDTFCVGLSIISNPGGGHIRCAVTADHRKCQLFVLR